LLAETGMRIGEAKWLTWEDVDFNHNLLLIRAKDTWRPKNGEDRDAYRCLRNFDNR
jgi:integrase